MSVAKGSRQLSAVSLDAIRRNQMRQTACRRHHYVLSRRSLRQVRCVRTVHMCTALEYTYMRTLDLWSRGGTVTATSAKCARSAYSSHVARGGPVVSKFMQTMGKCARHVVPL